ncbi:PEP-CTERM protein-sorting domain-containing protein [Terrimicrobium sacchariphilum]|uniref:PEP-CTERM protein-sorting domain-containing protein n=1 Tax=Terrimicrobium sacchariphilum TaxID=690879 RepID=A0A146GAB8_TERSA|nr:choice-of-anchor R domain-containing protein [Terrimicrobium sacchariphilum]GAT34585.1 PEP-CTERM protein-sorting domain-containing protein [Terrimicrobium sacchariphilum]
MHKRSLTCLALVGLAFISIHSTAKAAVIFSTYNNNDSGTASPIHNTSGKGLAFNMPSPLQPGDTTSYTLDSISLRLSGSILSSQIVLSLYTNDGSNTPGTLISSFTPTSAFTLTSTAASYTFTTSSAVTLTAGTTYWVTMYSTSSNTSGLSWKTSSPQPSLYSTVGVSLFGTIFGTTTNPANWTNTSSTVYNSLTVNATAVPEPGIAALSMLGILGLVGLRRLRSRA